MRVPVPAMTPQQSVDPYDPRHAFSGVQVSPGDLGAGIGQAVSGLGADAFQIAREEKAKADLSAVSDAANQHTAFSLQALATAQQATGRDARPAMDKALDDLDQKAGEISVTLSNDTQRAAFQRMAAERRNQALGTLLGHVGQQDAVYDRTQHEDGLKLSHAAMQAQSNDPVAVYQELDRANARSLAYASTHNQPKEVTDLELLANRQMAASTVLDYRLNTRDLAGAKEWLDAHGEDLVPGLRAKALSEINNLDANNQAISVAETAWQKNGADGAPRTVSDMLAEIDGQKDLMPEVRANARRHVLELSAQKAKANKTDQDNGTQDLINRLSNTTADGVAIQGMPTYTRLDPQHRAVVDMEIQRKAGLWYNDKPTPDSIVAEAELKTDIDRGWRPVDGPDGTYTTVPIDMAWLRQKWAQGHFSEAQMSRTADYFNKGGQADGLKQEMINSVLRGLAPAGTKPEDFVNEMNAQDAFGYVKKYLEPGKPVNEATVHDILAPGVITGDLNGHAATALQARKEGTSAEFLPTVSPQERGPYIEMLTRPQRDGGPTGRVDPDFINVRRLKGYLSGERTLSPKWQLELNKAKDEQARRQVYIDAANEGLDTGLYRPPVSGPMTPFSIVQKAKANMASGHPFAAIADLFSDPSNTGDK